MIDVIFSIIVYIWTLNDDNVNGKAMCMSHCKKIVFK